MSILLSLDLVDNSWPRFFLSMYIMHSSATYWIYKHLILYERWNKLLLHQHLQFFIICVLSLDLFYLDFCLVSLFFLRIMWLTTDGLLSRGNHKTNWFQNGYIDPYSLHREFPAVCVLIHWKWKTDTQISTHHSIYFCAKSSNKEKFDITIRCAQFHLVEDSQYDKCVYHDFLAYLKWIAR